METTKLRRFAQYARRSLLELVEAKLQLVLQPESAARRETPVVVRQLEGQIQGSSREQVIDRVAYTWFNRFCALRFMDVNGYTRIRVVSPADEGQFQPEILAEAKAGHIDEGRVPEKVRGQIAALLGGTTASHDPQQEAFRLLVVAECNSFHRAMPYLFERIADYTELLMPDDLLSGNSILSYTREAMTPDACRDVEVIGWLYQFYISEKKDEVFEGLKKNKKITPENIPAATQLFTPHWIVRYLVENSLGRLWMLNHPASLLAGQMDYYIKPEVPESDFLQIAKPEDIKVCDPACGSGHMLTYAFDLLYAIYEEVGTDPTEIPEKILTHNLYGIELDARAGELAAFALTMKARARQRRFFNKAIAPNICVLEKVRFSDDALDEYMAEVGPDLFTQELRETLKQFEEADNFGSLIRPKLTNVQDVLPVLESKDLAGNLFLKDTHDRVLKVLRQTDYLSPKYQVVIANPPYMGTKGMSARLGAWAKYSYPRSKSDLFAMFIERNLVLAIPAGAVAMITMQSWMFLSSFESLRAHILGKHTILSLAHLGAHAFDSIGGEVVSTVAFVLHNCHSAEYEGVYLRLVDGSSESEKEERIKMAIQDSVCRWVFRASSANFDKIPGSPIAYWVSNSIAATFDGHGLADVIITEGQNKTGNNDKYVRVIWETSRNRVGIKKKWLIYSKGGDYRKWFGNLEHLVDWSEEARQHYRKDASCRIIAEKYWYSEGITWTDITSSGTGFRYLPPETTFDMSGPTAFFDKSCEIYAYLCLLNSVYVKRLLPILNPTLHVQLRDIKSVPRLVRATSNIKCEEIARRCVIIGKIDWDYCEMSWDYMSPALLKPLYFQHSLETAYQQIRIHWRQLTHEMQNLEEASNRIFIDAYGLQDELTSEVPLKEITLTCNPHYRYGGNKTEQELEDLLRADTLREFLSYAVGCMFGRYSLDKPGLVLANQGETLADYLRQVPEPRFRPDEDNVIPFLDGDWFPDDVTERFRAFLRLTFGVEHDEENLAFIESALGKDIRKYFIRDFYTDHVKRYKKRPIYWLFASPKGTFNALIYLHRYRPDTVSVVLQYLRDFRKKLAARLDYLQQVGVSASASQGEKTRANKEIDGIKKQVLELDDYERDTLYPLATEQVALDLDDGVKVNYLKLGPALKKIVGLDAKGED